MAGNFIKYSVITNSIFGFLTLTQFTLNMAESQNLLRNDMFVEPVALEENQHKHDVQVQLADSVREEFQTKDEPQLPNLPNENTRQFKPKLLSEDQTLNVDDNKSPAHILEVDQFLGTIQQPSNEQLMTKIPLSVKNIFSGQTLNRITFKIKDAMKLLETTPFKGMENGLKMVMLFLKLNISMECLISLCDFQIGLKEGIIWAIRMIDSFGKIPNGILDGNRISFGDFEQCLDTESPGEYQGRYCLIKFNIRSNTSNRVPLQPIDLSFILHRDFSKSIFDIDGIETFMDVPMTTSICLPSNCSKKEVQTIFTEVVSYVDLPINIKVSYCYTREEFQFNRVQNIILYAMAILVLFEVFATILDFSLRYIYKEAFGKIELSIFVQCALAFSFYSNAMSIFQNTRTTDSIRIFNGMKVISTIWIVLSHTVMMSLLTLGRLKQVLSQWTEFFFQLIPNAIFATETFFFISGFLLTYLFIKANSQQISFVYYALIRTIRLMPPVLFILGCLFLSKNFSSGPMWKLITNFLIRPCKTKWWKTLLFINNMEEMEECCLLWTWYIATDMQLYLVSYLILLLIKMNPNKAALVMKFIIISSVGGLVTFYAIYQLPPFPVLAYLHPLDYDYYGKMMHLRPYNHLTPYFVGMFTGYKIATKKNITITRRRNFIGWFLAAIFALVCLFTTYIWNHTVRPATLIESAMYGGLHKLLWSLMLSWVVCTCVSGKAGIVVSILSWDGFAPFARLTYVVYLIHPLLQVLFVGQMKFTVFASFKLAVIVALGFVVVSYVFAFVASLICESPFIRLTSILISSKFNNTDDKKK